MNYMRDTMARGMAREIRHFIGTMRELMQEAVPLDESRRPSRQWLQATQANLRDRVSEAAMMYAWNQGEALAMMVMLFETATVDICNTRYTLYGEEVR